MKIFNPGRGTLKTKQKSHFLKKIFNVFVAVMLLASFAPSTHAYNFTNYKSLDVMKYTKDNVSNQLSDTAINNLVNTLGGLGITHIALSIPLDSTADYKYGTTPSPRTVEAYTQKWADVIHQKNIKIIWRGTFSGIEGIYNFPKLVGNSRFPTGTAGSAPTDGQKTWLGKIYSYIVNHPNYFKDGDVWAPLPERTENIFQDSTSFLSYQSPGIQTNYTTFFNNLKSVSSTAFSKITKNVQTGFTANNYTEVMSGWLQQSLFDTAGITAIDYYGSNHTPQEMDADIKKMYALHKKQIFIQEWGDYWNTSLSQTARTTYLQNMYKEMQSLVNSGMLAGFNYWGGWDNNAEGLLIRNGDSFSLNYRAQQLANFFKAN